MAEIFRSERAFTVWQYTVAHHARLLLRSSRRTESDTRIDLHVGGVNGMFLRPSYDGIVIREGTSEEVRHITSILGPEVFRQGGRLHVIGEDRMTGFVVGGPLECHEHPGADDDAPSGFLPMPETA
ncbi:hypothetical protein [Streptomyces sp. NPDC002573]|uniref:hypothetical protein n=1 Tax=Streptomyces sp. NPDC002573 TaxID=3364651 RepID=UPI003694ACF1